jgi:pectate lyase
MTNLTRLSVFGLLALSAFACSSGGGSSNPGTAGTNGAGTAGTTGGGGTTGSAGTTGAGGGTIVDTPMGTLLMDDFESGAAKWMFTQGTCMIAPDSAADGGMSNGTNVLNCINGGNEARALAGDVGWGEYTVQAKVKVNSMDAGRRIYLAARFRDSSNWYGAAIYNGTPIEVQIRKKVAGTSSDIARVPYAITFGTWYTLKLEVKGATLRLSVNDVVQLEATDTQFNSGQVALLVDRSDISWDDVLVTNP